MAVVEKASDSFALPLSDSIPDIL